MRKEIKQDINEIKKISSKFPKTINEALNFNEEEDSIETAEEPIAEPEIHHEEPQPVVDTPVETNASEKAKKLIDDIRKMSLRAMADLADTPEDENYIMLKKVWSMTDRKPEQDKNNL